MSGRGLLGGILLACCAGAAAQVQEPPPTPRFEIQRFIIEGNTIIPPAEVEAIVGPYTGKDRDFGSVQQALEALQEAYIERGYNAVRVSIPEQDLVAGRVRLQVLEARIREVRVEQNRFFDEANVRASFPSLQPGQPPNTRRVAQNAQLANENPAKQSVVRLDATDKPGVVDAAIRIVDEDPTRITAFVDNSGNSQTGQLRAGLGYQNANVLGRDHVLTAQFVTSPTKVNDVKIFGAGYRIPVYSWNGAVDLIAGYSDVNSGTIQDLFTVSGSGTILAARYTQILPPIDVYQHRLGLGWDYRDYKQNVALVGTTGTLVPDITIQPISLSYSGRLSRVGSDFSFGASIHHNLPGGTDGNQAAFTAQRVGAEARYTIYRAFASYTHTLPAGWLLRFAFNMQATPDLLVSAEQFGLGGADSVRGFNEREASHDKGHRLAAEVYTQDWGPQLGGGWRARALAFIDTASGADNAPQRIADNNVASVGVGVRISEVRGWALRADFGQVINGTPTRGRTANRFHITAAHTW